KSTGFVRDPAGTLIGMTSGGNPYYYVTDNQGAPSALVDNSGAKQGRWDYSPTGTARSGNTSSVDQPFGYTGAYLDSSGLYKMGARYNAPTLGRFTQPDPSGQEFNPYLYATSDPVNNIDPTGLSNSSLGYVNFALGAIGAAAGIVGLVAASPVVVGVAAGVGAAIGSRWLSRVLPASSRRHADHAKPRIRPHSRIFCRNGPIPRACSTQHSWK
ncbi:RHS repeat-associated core domain-containing protein, partial [Streptomyces seoulensis]|uniref:RHS repeat-associated core domain-containing protein n=1 Tax=Streptomyces seoulensis TaxID=73044 RepID=UPI0033A3AAFF